MQLSIIIVNWNSIELLRDCVQSLRRTISRLDYEIVIVDNLSLKDDSRQVLQTEEFASASDIQVVLSDVNLGFVRANNKGARQAKGNVFLFLNPDTVVCEDAVERLFSVLTSNERYGAAGARVLNGDMTVQTSAVQPFPTIANQLLNLDVFRDRWPMLPLWGIQALYSPPGAIVEVDVVSGACLMVKRDVFEKAGAFNLDYFMYAEEVDLCHRISQAGWKTVHVSDARVIHYGGHSSGQQSGGLFSTVLMRDSVHRFLKKTRGPVYAAGYRAGLLASAAIRMLLLAVPAVAGKGRGAMRKWFHVARWSVGLERWTEKLTADLPQV